MREKSLNKQTVPLKKTINKETGTKNKRHQKEGIQENSIIGLSSRNVQAMSKTSFNIQNSNFFEVPASLRMFLLRQVKQTVAVVRELTPQYKFLLFGEIPLDLDYFINQMQVREVQLNSEGIFRQFRPVRRKITLDNRIELEFDASRTGLIEFQHIIDAISSIKDERSKKFSVALQDYQNRVRIIISRNQMQNEQIKQNVDWSKRSSESFRNADIIINNLNPEKEIFIYKVISKQHGGLHTLKKGYSKGLLHALGVSENDIDEDFFTKFSMVDKMNHGNIFFAEKKMRDNPYEQLREESKTKLVKRNHHHDEKKRTHRELFEQSVRTIIKSAMEKTEFATELVALHEENKLHDKNFNEYIANPLPSFQQYQQFVKVMHNPLQHPSLEQTVLLGSIAQAFCKKAEKEGNNPQQNHTVSFEEEQEQINSNLQPLQFFDEFVEDQSMIGVETQSVNLNEMRSAIAEDEVDNLSQIFKEDFDQMNLSFRLPQSSENLQEYREDNSLINPMRKRKLSNSSTESREIFVSTLFEEFQVLEDSIRSQQQTKKHSIQIETILDQSTYSFTIEEEKESEKPKQAHLSEVEQKEFYDQLIQFIGADTQKESELPHLKKFAQIKTTIIKEFDFIHSLLEDSTFLPQEQFNKFIDEVRKQPKIKKMQILGELQFNSKKCQEQQISDQIPQGIFFPTSFEKKEKKTSQKADLPFRSSISQQDSPTQSISSSILVHHPNPFIDFQPIISPQTESSTSQIQKKRNAEQTGSESESIQDYPIRCDKQRNIEEEYQINLSHPYNHSRQYLKYPHHHIHHNDFHPCHQVPPQLAMLPRLIREYFQTDNCQNEDELLSSIKNSLELIMSKGFLNKRISQFLNISGNLDKATEVINHIISETPKDTSDGRFPPPIPPPPFKSKTKEVIKQIFRLNENLSTDSEIEINDFLEIFYIGKTKQWHNFEKDFLLDQQCKILMKELNYDKSTNNYPQNELVKKFYPQYSSNKSDFNQSQASQLVMNEEVSISQPVIKRMIKDLKMRFPHPFRILLWLKKALQKIVMSVPESDISQSFVKNTMKMLVFMLQQDTKNYVKCRSRIPIQIIDQIEKMIMSRLAILPKM